MYKKHFDEGKKHAIKSTEVLKAFQKHMLWPLQWQCFPLIRFTLWNKSQKAVMMLNKRNAYDNRKDNHPVD